MVNFVIVGSVLAIAFIFVVVAAAWWLLRSPPATVALDTPDTQVLDTPAEPAARSLAQALAPLPLPPPPPLPPTLPTLAAPPPGNPETRTLAIKARTGDDKLDDFCFQDVAQPRQIQVEGIPCPNGRTYITKLASVNYNTGRFSPGQCAWSRGADDAWNRKYVGDCDTHPTYWEAA